MKAGGALRQLFQGAWLAGVLCLAGCVLVPPTRVTTAVKTAAGKKAVLAPEVSVPGKTTRQELEERYRDFAVDTGTTSLFWGRYLESKWFSMIAPGPEGRVWHTRNILASFDESGTLKTFEVVPDKKLVARLVSLQKEAGLPPLDFSKPVEIAVNWWAESAQQFKVELSPTELTLNFSGHAWDESKLRWPRFVHIPAEQVTGLVAIDAGNCLNCAFETTRSEVSLKFSRKTAVGKSFELYAGQRDVFTLAHWLGQVKGERKPPNLQRSKE